MTKLNRKHGIEIGSKVKVISSEGSSSYNPRLGQILTVTNITACDGADDFDLIECDNIGNGQYPSRYELVTAPVELKPFMRATLRDGQKTIVSANASGSLALTFESGSWNEIQFASDENSDDNFAEYDIVAVYNAPSYYQAVDFNAKGSLVWEEDTGRADAEAEVAAAEAALAAARAKLAAI